MFTVVAITLIVADDRNYNWPAGNCAGGICSSGAADRWNRPRSNRAGGVAR